MRWPMTKLIISAFLLLSACSQENVGEEARPLCDCAANPHSCCCTTPIILDLDGNGVHLSSWTDGVVFPLDPRRGPGWRAWTQAGSDDAWLFRDHTGDGVATDGLELYGDMTEQEKPASGESRNGFRALAAYDDGDGMVDAKDPVFHELRLWTDADHDGVSTLDEVSDLKSHGIVGLSVVYDEPRYPDPHGNLFRYSAKVQTTSSSKVAQVAWDVALTSPTRTERVQAGLPEPVPASNEAPTVPATTAGIPRSLLNCNITMLVAQPTYNSIGSGTVKTRAVWYRTSGAADDCPYTSNPTNVRLYEYVLGEWRSRVVTAGAMADQQWKDAPKVCRFDRERTWVGEADFVFAPPFEGLSRYRLRGNQKTWPCSESDTSSDLPPCEQEP